MKFFEVSTKWYMVLILQWCSKLWLCVTTCSFVSIAHTHCSAWQGDQQSASVAWCSLLLERHFITKTYRSCLYTGSINFERKLKHCCTCVTKLEFEIFVVRSGVLWSVSDKKNSAVGEERRWVWNFLFHQIQWYRAVSFLNICWEICQEPNQMKN